jgi:hypothetical protein
MVVMERQYNINSHSLREIAVLMLISVSVVFVYGFAAKTYLNHSQAEVTEALASVQE